MNGEEVPVTQEELEQYPVPEVPPPAPAPALESVLGLILNELKGLKADNDSLRRDQAELRERLEQSSVVLGPGVAHTSDPIIQQTGGPNFARRVTLVTRPVQDSPQDYRNLVQTNDLRLPS